MPEQNEKKLPKAPAFNPKVKETIAAFKENNNPKNLNDILNELVRSPLLAPAVFDLQLARREKGGASHHAKRRMGTHLKCGTPNHKNQMSPRPRFEGVTCLHRLIRTQAIPVEPNLARAFHDVG